MTLAGAVVFGRSSIAGGLRVCCVTTKAKADRKAADSANAAHDLKETFTSAAIRNRHANAMPRRFYRGINNLSFIVFQLKDITGFGSAAADSFRV